jgi:nitrite reductase/ring-hydroxylating ferredoxin subunit
MDDQPRWRHDFPVDTDEDGYIARRDFTKFLVLTSFAFVAGQVWIAVQSLRRRLRSRLAPLQVAQVKDVPIGGAAIFAYPEAHDSCVLIRTADNQFLAYGSKCTHLSCAVLPDVPANVLRCPCHHGLFDLATGRALAGPPRRPLTRIHVECRGGAVFATGIEERTL